MLLAFLSISRVSRYCDALFDIVYSQLLFPKPCGKVLDVV
jgi:hypothetical protein